jgi:hypothetical protein
MEALKLPSWKEFHVAQPKLNQTAAVQRGEAARF